MSSLVHKLGLSSSLEFHEVYSLDPDMLAIVPRPAHALLLVFPVSQTYEKFRHEEDKEKQQYEGSGDGEEVLWYKQTIGNACGLIGLLHSVSNGHAKSQIQPGSDLANLLMQAVPLQPNDRAVLLEETDALEKAHQAAAVTGDTKAPDAQTDVDLHYVAFVKSDKNGHLFELDGRRKGPLDRGELKAEEDVLSENALDRGVRAFMEREAGDPRFSLIALAQAFD
jgi:ubiquitin carboxyl-terminal hydrolase L3